MKVATIVSRLAICTNYMVNFSHETPMFVWNRERLRREAKVSHELSRSHGVQAAHSHPNILARFAERNLVQRIALSVLDGICYKIKQTLLFFLPHAPSPAIAFYRHIYTIHTTATMSSVSDITTRSSFFGELCE